jgi:hypothetical protein
MPGRNGFAVCEYVKSHPTFSRIPVLLLVGIFEPFDKAEASRVLCDGVLTKPFETSQLIHMVRELLNAAGAGDSEQAPAVWLPPLEEPKVATTPTIPQPSEIEDVLSLEWDTSVSLGVPSDNDSILEIFDEELEAVAMAARAEPQPVNGPRVAEPESVEGKIAAVADLRPIPAVAATESELVAAAPVESPILTLSTAAGVGGIALRESEIDLIVERVLKRLSDRVVREVAWEVVPDLAEIIIKERLKDQRLPQ